MDTVEKTVRMEEEQEVRSPPRGFSPAPGQEEELLTEEESLDQDRVEDTAVSNFFFSIFNNSCLQKKCI